MFSLSKKIKLISSATTTLLVLFSVSLPQVVFGANVVDVRDTIVRTNTGTIVTNTKDTVTNTNRIAKLLAGDEGENKGAEYYRLQAVTKQVEVKTLLRQVSSSTIKWVNTGDNGNPFYVTNAGLYLSSTTDNTINTFLTDDKTLDTACESLKTPVKQAIGLQYSTFDKKIKCTVTDTAKMDKFTSGDFTEGGGWDSWGEIIQPQNNPIGAMIIAQNELDRRIEANAKAAELEATWGNGFKPYEKCVTLDANWDRNYDGCTTLTPGAIISEALVNALNSNSKVLEVAADFGQLKEITDNKTEIYAKVPASVSSAGLGGKKINSNDVSAAFDAYMASIGNGSTNTGGTTPNNTSPVDLSTLPNSTDRNTTIDTSNLPDTNNIINLAEISNNPYVSNANTTINFSLSLTIDATTNKVTYIQRDTTIKLIDLQTAIEARYYNAQNNIYKLLEATETAFATSTALACTADIKSPIINQIEGLIPYDKTITGNLPWNKTDVASSSAIALDNINALTIARMAIVSDPTSPQSIALVQYIINRHAMHSNTEVTSYSAGGYIFTQIKTWTVNKLNIYGESNLCVVDKSPFLPWGIQ